MKTFKDLVFKPHSNATGLQALLMFENGYGVSVVRFKHGAVYGSYTNNESEWEIGIMVGDENDCRLTYNTPITDDVRLKQP